MNITPDTKVLDVLNTYPWLRDELPKMDKRFAIMNTPPGKLLLRRATLKDVAKKADVTPEKIIEKFNELLASHSSNT